MNHNKKNSLKNKSNLDKVKRQNQLGFDFINQKQTKTKSVKIIKIYNKIKQGILKIIHKLKRQLIHIKHILIKSIGKLSFIIRLYKKFASIQIDIQKKKNKAFWIGIIIFTIIFISSFLFVSFDETKHFKTTKELQQYFTSINYRLDAIRYNNAPVPRVFTETLPKDFEFIENRHHRKDAFIKFLLPLILKVNEEIEEERKQLLTISYKIRNEIILTKQQLDFLYKLAEKYKTDVNDLPALIKKIDKISVALAIAQSAQETGWGTSHFLLDGNALFAQWTWSYDGMLPRSREKNLNHRVKTFPTLLDSVRSYALVLNSTKYYSGYRNMRLIFRNKGQVYDGISLVETLKYYSTTKEYIDLVSRIITSNALYNFETAKLSKEELEPKKSIFNK